MRCQACRRPLTNPVSKQHGLGPDCLRRAVKAGTAPLEALEEIKAWQRTKRGKESIRHSQENAQRCDSTLDLFEAARAEALTALNAAAAECIALGIAVTIQINNE